MTIIGNPLIVGGGSGGGSAITVIDTPDVHGGTIREIVAVDISHDTVTANTLLTGITAHDAAGNAITGNYSAPTLQSSKTVTISSNTTTTITPDGTYDGMEEVVVTTAVPVPNLQSSKSVTISASGNTTVSPGTGYDAMEEVAVTTPAGTAGTPSATKGAVVSNSVTVTPSVTNSTGWITGGTITGTAVTVTASELISFSTIRTGSGTPAPALGVDGDIYIQTS